MGHLALLKSMIGKEEVIQSGLIDLSLVQRFASAIGDFNPAYWTKNDTIIGIPVPPTLIFEVNFNTDKESNEEDGSYPEINQLRDKLSVLRAGNDYEVLRPVMIGDRIKVVRKVSNVYEKEGKRGKLIFVDLEFKYYRNDTDHVGTNYESLILLNSDVGAKS